MKKITLLLALCFYQLSQVSLADHPEGTIKVDIYGLVCDFCARALEKVFGKEDSVEQIEVDLDKKLVTIHLKQGQSIEDAIIRKNIIDAGYNIEEIHRGG